MSAFNRNLIIMKRVVKVIGVRLGGTKMGVRASIWIEEDEDYIVKLVTLPGIVPNRRNDRERSNSMYHSHDLNRRTE